MVTHNDKSHYTTNVQAILGQVATDGGAEHLEEQLTCLQIPSVTKATLIQLERHLGTVFEQIVSDNLLAAGKERDLAIANDEYHCGVPAITVVVDGGWSKRSHKHSYNAKSGVGIIFGAAKKKLFFIGVRNKYCSVCAISKRKNSPPPSHQCYCNWRWFIGDGDGSVYHAVVTGVPSYGYRVQKVE